MVNRKVDKMITAIYSHVNVVGTRRIFGALANTKKRAEKINNRRRRHTSNTPIERQRLKETAAINLNRKKSKNRAITTIETYPNLGKTCQRNLK